MAKIMIVKMSSWNDTFSKTLRLIKEEQEVVDAERWVKHCEEALVKSKRRLAKAYAERQSLKEQLGSFVVKN